MAGWTTSLQLFLSSTPRARRIAIGHWEGTREGMSAGLALLGTYSNLTLLCNEANAILMAFEKGPIEGDAVYPWIAAGIADVLSTKKRT